MTKKQEKEYLLREINSPKSELMRIRDQLYNCSVVKANRLDRLIEKIEALQNS